MVNSAYYLLSIIKEFHLYLNNLNVLHYFLYNFILIFLVLSTFIKLIIIFISPIWPWCAAPVWTLIKHVFSELFLKVLKNF